MHQTESFFCGGHYIVSVLTIISGLATGKKVSFSSSSRLAGGIVLCIEDYN